uniref:Uncharacterized protein n=1 Tax=Human betaherpesvirus 6 TaxID=10368 RepID=A0A5P9U7R3_9BETA|nr:hypothetical protein [Human betaherpesvirus 6]
MVPQSQISIKPLVSKNDIVINADNGLKFTDSFSQSSLDVKFSRQRRNALK